MQLLEFQAKELFREYGINLLESISSTNIEKGREDAKKLGYPFVIKIQVPVGGRGKAGGIQKCQNDDEFELKYPQVMDLTIKGEKARAILLEKMADIKKELYLSIFLNRSKRCYTIIASAEGGVEIESVKNQIIKEIGLGEVSSELAKERGTYPSYDGSLWSQGIFPKDSIDILEKNRGSEFIKVDRSETLDWEQLRAKVKKDGMRNSNVMAIAPTATISNITGVTQSIEPTYQNLYVKSNLSGEFTIVNPDKNHDAEVRVIPAVDKQGFQRI